MFYILEDKKPVPVDFRKYAEWSADFSKRIIKQTELPGGVRVSTVFLGLNHAFGDEDPVLFETMIFGGEHDQDQWRYCTWEEAEQGHEEAIKLCFE